MKKQDKESKRRTIEVPHPSYQPNVRELKADLRLKGTFKAAITALVRTARVRQVMPPKPRRPLMTMPKQGDTTPCPKTGCDGTLTYHENIDAEGHGHPEKYPAWRCDTCDLFTGMKMKPS